jgi:hypothetical protein
VGGGAAVLGSGGAQREQLEMFILGCGNRSGADIVVGMMFCTKCNLKPF